nr:hypothetical protein Cry52Nrm3_p013 [Cryptomonas curvata]
MKTKKGENNTCILALLYFQIEMLKFFLYSVKIIFQQSKKFVKIKNKDTSLYLKKKKTQIIDMLQQNENSDKFYNQNINHLKEWDLDPSYKYPKFITNDHSKNYDINHKFSYLIENSESEKKRLNSQYDYRFKESIEVKLPQKKEKKKIVKYKKKKEKKIEDHVHAPYLNILAKFYKIPISYFSSNIFTKPYNKKDNLINKRIIYSFPENNLPKSIHPQAINYDAQLFLISDINSPTLLFKKSISLNKFLFQIFKKNFINYKLKNCKNTKYIIINVTIGLENCNFENKKKKILNMINIYESLNKYKISYKQFMPYGDIFFFIPRNSLKQKN